MVSFAPEDIFVHYSDIVKCENPNKQPSLAEGELVEFDLVTSNIFKRKNNQNHSFLSINFKIGRRWQTLRQKSDGTSWHGCSRFDSCARQEEKEDEDTNSSDRKSTATETATTAEATAEATATAATAETRKPE